MRLFLLVCLTMTAFAANSILNRMALADGAVGPASFAATRVFAGVVVLAVLVLLRGQGRRVLAHGRVWAVIGLTAYMAGFSFAYVTLDAGIGALILFGGVQMTMFTGAVLRGNNPQRFQWLGAGIAFAGLVWLLLPGSAAPSILGAGLMLLAALGWGIYSLQGQGARDPLAATTANFALALPLVLLVWLCTVAAEPVSARGIVLGLISGGVTSALGYALWYHVLPQLHTATAAVSQLSVPLIAMAGGMVFLNEPLTGSFLFSATLILGGICISVFTARKN